MANGARIASNHPSSHARVVVIGSESTGKTVLAEQLAAHYRVPLSAEFVRRYAEMKGAPLDASDVEQIARGQLASENEAAERADRADSRLVIFDTDLNSTVIYSRHYYGACPAWIDEAARSRLADLYLILDIDVPWVADPQRDRGDRRSEMHRLFQQRLEQIAARHVEVSGSWANRFARAMSAIDSLLRDRGRNPLLRRPDAD
jgi:NadR type nicotinamide-nucleotide adenylyltransferase